MLGPALIAACATTIVNESGDAAAALPPGEGREILARECLKCHELDALELFRGFYTRDRWRALVVTMRENGAEVDADELEVLADYLALNFGTGG